MREESDSVIFVGYEQGNTVARFVRPFERGDEASFVLNRENCAIRLANQKRDNRPHEQTQAALDGWPEQSP